jgi:hypothetical protein
VVALALPPTNQETEVPVMGNLLPAALLSVALVKAGRGAPSAAEPTVSYWMSSNQIVTPLASAPVA